MSLVPTGALPPILVNAGQKGAERFWDFFTSTIRNANTRAAYLGAVTNFFHWLQKRKITEFTAVKPIHVAAYVEQLQTIRSKPTTKQHVAAIRMLLIGTEGAAGGTVLVVNEWETATTDILLIMIVTSGEQRVEVTYRRKKFKQLRRLAPLYDGRKSR